MEDVRSKCILFITTVLVSTKCALYYVLHFELTGLADSKCTAKKGICKYTSQGCSGGGFKPGLCSGNTNRQCCIPSGETFLLKIVHVSLFIVEYFVQNL